MEPRRPLTRAAARAPLPRWAVRVAVAAATLIIVAPASAHVVVLPSVAPEGTPTEFTLQVPTERNLPTTAVRVMFPPQVSVYSFQVPPPGFTVTPILAKNQSIIGAVFRGTIPVGEYQAFHFLGTPFSTGQTRWPAYQTYADGLVKPWNGPVEAPGAVSAETGADPARAHQRRRDRQGRTRDGHPRHRRQVERFGLGWRGLARACRDRHRDRCRRRGGALVGDASGPTSR